MAEREHPNPERLWRHRRWMGWYGVLGMTVSAAGAVAASLALSTASVEAVRPVMIASVWAHFSLAAVYAGGACLVDATARLRGAGS